MFVIAWMSLQQCPSLQETLEFVAICFDWTEPIVLGSVVMIEVCHEE